MAAAGYCFAYYFYFVFVCTENKKWKLTGFLALVFYVLIVIYLAYAAATTLNIPELILNVLKAIFNTIVGYHAYLLYKVPRRHAPPPPRAQPLRRSIPASPTLPTLPSHAFFRPRLVPAP